MKIIYNPLIFKHIGNELECPERVLNIKGAFTGINRKEAEKAINLLYTKKNNLKLIKKTCQSKNTIAEVKLNNDSYEAILASVGLGLKALINNDFALVRPPGHHANLNSSRGFCIINNIAVIANKLLNENKKVAIIDIDGHHCDGTHEIFKKEKNIFLCSLYQNYAYPFFPFSETKAKELALYIPLKYGSGDNIFREAFKKFIEQVLLFRPDVIAVSAGFDGYFKESLLDLNFTEHSYYFAGKALKETKIPTFAMLEGGYHQNLNDCIQAFISGYNGKNYYFKNKKTTSLFKLKK